jgi:hypothetical protein
MLLSSFAVVAPTPIEQRADALLARMSLDEIIQQTWAPYGGTAEHLLDKIGNNGVGQLSFSMAGRGSLEARVEARNALQAQIMRTSKHGIPASFSNEALHGAVAGGTIFPELVTQGTSWDPELIEQIGEAIAREARAVGVDTAFSPVLNMWVDARFGRLQEGYSENPTLTTAYALAALKGSMTSNTFHTSCCRERQSRRACSSSSVSSPLSALLWSSTAMAREVKEFAFCAFVAAHLITCEARRCFVFSRLAGMRWGGSSCEKRGKRRTVSVAAGRES